MEVFKLIINTYIVFFIFLLILGLVVKIKIKNYYYLFSVIFSLCLGYYGYCLDPGYGLDLSRLHIYIQSLDFENNMVQSLLGINNSVNGNSMEGMIGWNMICYFVSCLGDVRWLSAVSVFIVFLIMSVMIIDYCKVNNYTSQAISLCLIIVFMGMQLQYVFSGIRNALAVSISAMALYLYYIKDFRFWIPITLGFVAFTIHPIVIILVIPFFVAQKKNQRLFRVAVLFTVPLLLMIPSIIGEIQVPFISTIINRISFYSETQYQYDRPEMIANIIIFLVTSLCYETYKKRNWFNSDVKSIANNIYLNFYYLIGIIMIGCSYHRDFSLRIGYIMGIAACPLLCNIFFDNNRKKKLNYVSIALILSIIACCSKVYYDTWFGMSKWNF